MKVLLVIGDGLSSAAIEANAMDCLAAIREGLQVVPGTKLLPFSAQTKQGREEIWEVIDGLTADSGEEAPERQQP